MIVDLPDTTTSQISKALVKIREEGGAVALGRVLTLVIATRTGRRGRGHRGRQRRLARAPDARHRALDRPGRPRQAEARARRRRSASAATPARARSSCSRAYGDAARDEESLVTGLLLPDAPVVAWWPGAAPDASRDSALGAHRAAAHHGCRDAAPTRGVRSHASASTTRPATPTSPGPGSRSGARSSPRCSTSRRTSPSPPSRSAGAIDSPSTTLLAAWLQLAARGADRPACSLRRDGGSHGIHGVRLDRASGVDRARARHAGGSPPWSAGPADARPRAPPPQPARLPRRGAAPPRPGRPVRSR